MVKIIPLQPYLPKKPEIFCSNPYDVIGDEEKAQLKENSDSLIHLILPDGEGEEIYRNAALAFENFKKNSAISREKTPSIFVYRQESPTFSQQGFILSVSLEDYENNRIIKHEHTRQKPLKDRTNHIVATNVAAGLIWTVYQTDQKINNLMEEVKKKDPIMNFEMYGYKQILWQESNAEFIQKLVEFFKERNIYIADGHHRAASAAEYRKIQIKNLGTAGNETKDWQNLMVYLASDDQVRILPYNRVIRKLPIPETEFLEKLEQVYTVTQIEKPENPSEKHELTICCKSKWYKLKVKDTKFQSERDALDVAILQDEVLAPILGIKDIRASDNIFFVGGIRDPKDMEKYISDKGNDIFFNLYPVSIRDLQKIADIGGVMPPKSTWFDPKVLSGLVLHVLNE
jgi:uncharacterized protein (DUF1015 family)